MDEISGRCTVLGGAFGDCGPASTCHGQELYVRNMERLRVVGRAGVLRNALLRGPWPIISLQI